MGLLVWRQSVAIVLLTQKSNTNSIRRGVAIMWGTKKGGATRSLGHQERRVRVLVILELTGTPQR